VRVGEIKQVFIPLVGYRKAYVSVRKPIHFFKKFRGFGIDSGIIKTLIEQKIEWVVIDYQGTRKRVFFISKTEDWLLNGTPVHYNKEYDDQNASFGRQLVLSKAFMKERGS